ncbi:MAG: leucine-rich repeat domain-containing protein [Myxococcota bacterium]
MRRPAAFACPAVLFLCLAVSAFGQPKPASPPAPAADAIEATKEAQRVELRKLEIFPKGAKERLNLDAVILDWTADGHVRAARIASAKAKMTAAEPGVTALDPVAQLDQLEQLDLWGVAVTDLTPIQTIATLKAVDIRGCLKLTALSPLSKVGALTRLHLEAMPGVNLSALLGVLTGLTRLELVNQDVTDAALVADLTGLEYLDLSNNKKLKDVAPLARLTNLAHLDLTGTGVLTVDALVGLDTLRLLRVSRKVDIRPLLGLKVSQGLRIEVK